MSSCGLVLLPGGGSRDTSRNGIAANLSTRAGRTSEIWTASRLTNPIFGRSPAFRGCSLVRFSDNGQTRHPHVLGTEVGPIRWIAAGLCAWEVGAIATGKVPTLTQLSARNRWLGPVLVVALAVHLYRAPRVPRQAADCLLCPVDL